MRISKPKYTKTELPKDPKGNRVGKTKNKQNRGQNLASKNMHELAKRHLSVPLEWCDECRTASRWSELPGKTKHAPSVTSITLVSVGSFRRGATSSDRGPNTFTMWVTLLDYILSLRRRVFSLWTFLSCGRDKEHTDLCVLIIPQDQAWLCVLVRPGRVGLINRPVAGFRTTFSELILLIWFQETHISRFYFVPNPSNFVKQVLLCGRNFPQAQFMNLNSRKKNSKPSFWHSENVSHSWIRIRIVIFFIFLFKRLILTDS